MKKIFLLSCLLMSVFFVSTAQEFEGVLKYDLKYEGDQVSQFASMMPNGYSLKMKGDKSRFSINGGMVSSFMGDVVSDGKAQLSYVLMPQQKIAYKVSTKEDASKNTVKPKVTNTGLVETIKGYKCTKYKIVLSVEGNEMVSYMWTTKDINIKLPASASKQTALQIYDGVDGFPVKIEQNISQMGMSFTLTVMLNEAKQMAIADSDFALPSDYKVQEGMPDFGGMLGK
jgi:hypothetical protein